VAVAGRHPGAATRASVRPRSSVLSAWALLLGIGASALWTTGAAAADAAGPGSPALETSDPVDQTAQSRPHRRVTDPFAIDVSATTWVPLSVGPEVTAELPGRVLLSAHVGWMPELYGRSVTDVLRRSGSDDRVGPLLDGAIQDATLWRVAAGWRPLARAGLELTAGYAHVGVDGRSTSAEIAPLLPAALGAPLSEELGASRVNLTSSIHNLTIAAGWRWLIAEHLVIRASLGYLHALSSASTLEVEDRPDLTRLAAPTVERTLNERYTRYVRLPVVGLGVGYRF
jgi:hypothetical protein